MRIYLILNLHVPSRHDLRVSLTYSPGSLQDTSDLLVQSFESVVTTFSHNFSIFFYLSLSQTTFLNYHHEALYCRILRSSGRH
jgi:hypothetical protein